MGQKRVRADQSDSDEVVTSYLVSIVRTSYQSDDHRASLYRYVTDRLKLQHGVVASGNQYACTAA